MGGTDAWASATNLGSGLSGSDTGNNAGFGREASEVQPSATNDFKTAWWKWTCPAGSPIGVMFTTLGTSFDTVLSAWTGASVSTLSEAASNDDMPADGSDSAISWRATPGTTYYIKVGSLNSTVSGAIALAWATGADAASNDDFADAVDLGSGTSGAFHTNNVGATTESEPQDPYPTDIPDQTVWAAWTCPGVDRLDVAIDQTFCSFGALVNVFGGSSLGDLTLLANNNQDLATPMVFRAEPGETYYIRVGSYTGSGDEGNVWLSWTTTVADPPANDYFADAIDLGSGHTATDVETNVGAAFEGGEPIPSASSFGSFSATLWWKWTAPSDVVGNVTVTTHGSVIDATVDPLDTILAVYTGTDLSDLVEVASNDDDPDAFSTSKLVFAGVADTVYWIQVASYSSTDRGDVHVGLHDQFTSGGGGFLLPSIGVIQIV